MDLEDVRAFVAVAEAGSVSRAASELYLTQPAVTRRVRRLEETTGATLLDRGNRPLTLTEAGRSALERCRRLLSTAEELRSIAAPGSLPAGELRVGVAHALSELALWEPVERVKRTFQRVALRLRTGWSRDLVERVRAGGLHAAVVLLPEADRPPGDAAAEVVGREDLVVIGSRRAARSVRQLADLREREWVLSPEGCAGRALLQQALLRAGIPLRVNVEAYSYDLQLSLVARGRGLGLVPRRLLARSPTRRRLRALRVRGLSLPFTIWLVRGEVPDMLQPPLQVLGRGVASGLSRRRA